MSVSFIHLNQLIPIYFLSGMHKHAILNFMRANDFTILVSDCYT